jgi:hypothetical protein
MFNPHHFYHKSLESMIQLIVLSQTGNHDRAVMTHDRCGMEPPGIMLAG